MALNIKLPSVKKIGGKVVIGAKNAKEKIEATKIGGKIVETVDKAIELAKKIGTPYALLLPVKPQMVAALKIKGLPVPKEIDKLAESFYNKVVKQSNFDTQVDNNPHGFATFGETTHVNHMIPPEVISSVVTAIISYIGAVKKKKQEGKDLSKAEKAINEVSETAETAAIEGATDVAHRLTGETIIKYLPYVLGGIVLIIVAKKLKWF